MAVVALASAFGIGGRSARIPAVHGDVHVAGMLGKSLIGYRLAGLGFVDVCIGSFTAEFP